MKKKFKRFLPVPPVKNRRLIDRSMLLANDLVELEVEIDDNKLEIMNCIFDAAEHAIKSDGYPTIVISISDEGLIVLYNKDKKDALRLLRNSQIFISD